MENEIYYVKAEGEPGYITATRELLSAQRCVSDDFLGLLNKPVAGIEKPAATDWKLEEKREESLQIQRYMRLMASRETAEECEEFAELMNIVAVEDPMEVENKGYTISFNVTDKRRGKVSKRIVTALTKEKLKERAAIVIRNLPKGANLDGDYNRARIIQVVNGLIDRK